MNRTNLKEKYLDAAARFSLLEAKEDRTLLVLSVLRFICFTGGIVLVVLSFISSSPLGIAALLLISFLFLFLLKLFAEHSEKKEFSHNLSVVNRNEAEAVTGNIEPFEPGNKYFAAEHDFSSDVDLFGISSVFRYLNRTVTGYGSDQLAEWLSDPFAVSSELQQRQEIVKELSGKVEWRQRFMATGMKVPFDKGNISSLNAWLAKEPETADSRFRILLLYTLPGMALASLALVLTGVLNYSFFLLIFLINLFYAGISLKTTNRIHNVLSGHYLWLSSVDSLLKLFIDEKFASARLGEMKKAIAGQEISASVAVRKLGNLIRSFDSRLNIFAGFILNGLFLWDLQCVHRLSKWKSEYMKLFPEWLGILARIDAFSSLANFAYNNEGFSYPVMTGGDIIFSAGSLGHPLIDEDSRVSNDFNLEKKGRICIITGANMAGKSTFLRTVAVNYILAMTGAPVCAKWMKFSPVRLFSSMRTTDSLAGHESYFYAELKRLRTLKNKVASGEPVFFILDEILKGTNSADKAMGSKMFLRKMISMGGTGIIATHDISLGELETEFKEVQNMCFEIDIDGETIHFDYRLCDGITKKMNAAFLMKQMGILD